uniref:EBP50 C-terminal domain-containing protein n=1 Tax=Oncorhynchus mykiss TaxID=8022 RepID=A0A8C7WF77_ONCMY
MEKSISETSLKDLIAEYEDDNELKDMAASSVLISVTLMDSKAELHPRLRSMKKGVTGYVFNLHSEKSKPGQYIRAVDEESPADKVNSMSVVGMQHSEVVAAIKAGGDETSLLVVDREAEAFFNSCNVIPTAAHLTGPLPEQVSNGGAEEEELDGKVAVKPVSASTSKARVPPVKEPNASLSMSLSQAKERAHQKGSSKKAPAMDWSKRNKLFSNL